MNDTCEGDWGSPLSKNTPSLIAPQQEDRREFAGELSKVEKTALSPTPGNRAQRALPFPQIPPGCAPQVDQQSQACHRAGIDGQLEKEVTAARSEEGHFPSLLPTQSTEKGGRANRSRARGPSLSLCGGRQGRRQDENNVRLKYSTGCTLLAQRALRAAGPACHAGRGGNTERVWLI